MGDYEKTICELYDNNPSNYQIRSIAKMYNIDEDEVKDILARNDRELPKAGRPKATIKAADKKEPETEPQEAAAKEDTKTAPIPDAVKNLIFGRIDELDKNLADLNQRINGLVAAKNLVIAEYKVLADYISLPFGAGNLSQESSENMVESPQADA